MEETPIPIGDKVITGGENRKLKINKWSDLSKSTAFLKDCKTHEHAGKDSHHSHAY
jgi:hypothetical protein